MTDEEIRGGRGGSQLCGYIFLPTAGTLLTYHKTHIHTYISSIKNNVIKSQRLARSKNSCSAGNSLYSPWLFTAVTFEKQLLHFAPSCTASKQKE